MFIEEWEQEEAMEQHFVEAHEVQRDVGEENVVEVEVHLSTEMQVGVCEPIEVQAMGKSTTKGNGDWEAWVGSCSKEKTPNPGKSYTCGERY